MDSFLTLRGIKTLHVRMERHCKNALALAKYLESHESVKWVNYAALPTDRYHNICIKNTKGQILDIGCLMGGAGFIMSKKNIKGKTYLFDSFSGFKKDDGLHKKEVFFYDDIGFVKENIKKLKFLQFMRFMNLLVYNYTIL